MMYASLPWISDLMRLSARGLYLSRDDRHRRRSYSQTANN